MDAMKIETPYESIILMGKTGCGKGTQAKLLAETLGYRIFSTGDEIRRIGSENTPFGRRVQEIQVSGWVPEWLASYLMTKVLLENFAISGLVFESVARKPEEAHKLHEIHAMLERPYIVVHLDISDEEATRRMQKRGRDASDQAENIKKRLAAYHNETLVSLDFFKSEGKVRQIDADQSPEQVFEDIIRSLQNK